MRDGLPRPRGQVPAAGGSPIALNWAIDAVRKGGTVSVMGAYGPMFSAVKFGDAMNKGLTPNMNQCPVKRQWPRLFDHIRNGYFTHCHASNSASSTSLRATASSPRSSTTASSQSSLPTPAEEDPCPLSRRPPPRPRHRRTGRPHTRMGRRPGPRKPPRGSARTARRTGPGRPLDRPRRPARASAPRAIERTCLSATGFRHVHAAARAVRGDPTLRVPLQRGARGALADPAGRRSRGVHRGAPRVVRDRSAPTTR